MTPCESRALEEERGRTLADDLAEATGGNPLLLRVALAEASLPRVEANATDALRHSVEARAKGIARKVLALLAAAQTPLEDSEVVHPPARAHARPSTSCASISSCCARARASASRRPW